MSQTYNDDIDIDDISFDSIYNSNSKSQKEINEHLIKTQNNYSCCCFSMIYWIFYSENTSTI